MARKSAAQIAAEELAAAKAKEQSNEQTAENNGAGGDSNEETASTDTNTPPKGENAASGVSGGSGEDSESKPDDEPAVEIEKVHALALRDLPGTDVKLGQIIKAPVNLIDLWDKFAWVDTNDNALKFAEQDHAKREEKRRLLNPAAPALPQVVELNHKGEIIDPVIEE